MNRDPIILIFWLASLVHVGVQSVKMKRVGRPFWHVVMVGLAAWPISYFIWLLYWPGTLIKSKAELASEMWVENLARRKKGCDPVSQGGRE